MNLNLGKIKVLQGSKATQNNKLEVWNKMKNCYVSILELGF